MDEQTNVAQTPETEEKEKKGLPRWLKILVRVLTVLFSILLVLTAVVLVAHRDELNLDSFRRYLNYRALERGEEGQGAAYALALEENTQYAALDDCLIACSGNRILIYSDSGTAYVDMGVTIGAPVIQTAGDYALIYDAGGSDLYLFSARQMIFHYSTEKNYSLISARVNDNGWMAVVEQASGYKGSVTVYNANQDRVIGENISSRFVMDAVVSPDNQKLAVITIGQDGLDFAGILNIYRCTDGEEILSATVTNDPPLEMRWDGSGIWLQENNGVRLVSPEGEERGSWKDNSLYLRGYSINGNDYAAEYFSRYRSGAMGELVVIDTEGKVKGTLNVNEEVLSVTASGRYIAVLTSQRLTVYTSDLEEYGTLPNVAGIRQALVRSDGTAVLVMAETANIFLP